MKRQLHHINFLVTDLDTAISRFCLLFDLPEPPVEELSERSVRLARFRLGDLWFILVQPTDQDSVPARHLRIHGEGFFLVSVQVDELAAAAADLASHGIRDAGTQVRQGLDDWKVLDLDSSCFNGINVQLVESGE